MAKVSFQILRASKFTDSQLLSILSGLNGSRDNHVKNGGFFNPGEVISEKDRCKKCEGKKVIKEVKILEVHVDKGMKHGQKITFGGEADQAPGVEPGDIVLVLQEKEHEVQHSLLSVFNMSP